jgi:ribonuclease J
VLLDPGDRVIFSNRVIPGNEPAVTLMTNGFLRQGVEVRSSITDPGVHVSGHAYRDEQSRMIDLVQPRGFVPVHGTLHHLHQHGKLARELGVPEVVVLENGEIAERGPETPLRKLRDTAEWGRVPTWAGEPIPDRVLADREAIARSGVAFVTVLVDGWGRPAGPTTVSTRGVLDEEEDAIVLREAAREVDRALETRPNTRERPTDEEIAEIARLAARKRLELAVKKKPVTVANVVRVRA